MSSRRSKSTTPLPKKKRKQADLYTIKNVKVISKGEKYKGALVLLTTAIYTNNVPSAAVGKVFLYRVETYDEEMEMFSVKWEKQAMEEDGGSVFFAFDEHDDSSLDSLTFADIRDGQRRYYEYTTRTLAAEQNQRELIEMELENERKDPEKSAWLEDAHEAIGCKPSYVGSHTVE